MHTLNPASAQLLDILVDRLNIGIFAVDRNMEVTLWNRYMESHSAKPAADVLGRNLFECFADLPRKMLLHKINSVFILKNFAFTSWEQRPYQFKFRHNRRDIEEAVAKEFQRVQRYGGTLSLILFDLDNFKAINDNHGHLAGDEVLRCAAKHIGAGIRQADTFGRYGGEEFLALLPATTIDGATVLAERLRVQLAATPVTLGALTIPVTVSAGIAEWHPGMQRYEKLINAADEALYEAKERGRNRVQRAAALPNE